jgi:hypothetical protein
VSPARKPKSAATLDRFEGENAVLQVDGKTVNIARAKLPKEAREGDVIDSATLKVLTKRTSKAREGVAQQQAKLKLKARRPGNFKL